LRVPAPPAQGDFHGIGLTKALFGKFRLDANVFRRDFHNYSDDDVLLQTDVSFPAPYSRARITGEEVRLEAPHWGRFSGFVSYANQSGLGQGPITGGLFIGSDAQGVLTDTSKFAVSQDQRNTLRARVRFQATTRLWFAIATQYGSGLPADLGDDTNVPSLIGQFGERVVSRANLERGRVDPNSSLDLATGAGLYRQELRTLQFQLEPANVTDHIKVIYFDSLFSGTAVGTPRVISARLRFTF
jgi:hypothetical protein